MPESVGGAGRGAAAPGGARLPRALGDAVVAATPLRHGLGTAATGGIWRVRGMAGSAILKVARLSATGDPNPRLAANPETVA